MKEVLERGEIALRDREGKSYTARWEAWQDRTQKRVEIHWNGFQDTCSFTSAQDDSRNRIQLAFMLFDRLLRDVGIETVDA